MTDTTNMTMDELLDNDLDSFADMPEFVTPPAGVYTLNIVKMEAKTINDKPVMQINFKVLETAELTNAGDTPVDAGTPFNVSYFLNSDFGQGALKKVTANIKEALGVRTTRELMEACQGMEVSAVLSNRKDKNDATKVYVQVVEMFPA